jgi:hypothetical protein
VLNFTPDRKQLLCLAAVAQTPMRWWTAQYRWVFSNSGTHGGNHCCTERLQYGVRYNSNIVSHDDVPDSMPPVESSVSKYVPCIVAGGRLLHLKLPSTDSSILGHVSMEGYTLLVMDCKVRVTGSSQRFYEREHIRRRVPARVCRRARG